MKHNVILRDNLYVVNRLKNSPRCHCTCTYTYGGGVAHAGGQLEGSVGLTYF